MWQTDAIGLQKCDLRLPSPFTEAVTTITVLELSDSIGCVSVYMSVYSNSIFLFSYTLSKLLRWSEARMVLGIHGSVQLVDCH
jgi:hypothetical protein